MERIKAEMDWIAEHKIEYVYCADGNFGLFDRDEEIAEYIISLKRKPIIKLLRIKNHILFLSADCQRKRALSF